MIGSFIDIYSRVEEPVFGEFGPGMFAVTDDFNHCVTARSRSENLLRLIILCIVSLSGVFWMQGIVLARDALSQTTLH